MTVQDRNIQDKTDNTDKAEDIVDDCLEYEEEVGDYITAPITKIEEVEKEDEINKIELYIDIPFDTGIWEFDKPYKWDTDKFFPNLVENYNYSKYNFHQMIGENVLVKYDEEDGSWYLEDRTRLQYKEDMESSLPWILVISILLALAFILIILI